MYFLLFVLVCQVFTETRVFDRGGKTTHRAPRRETGTLNPPPASGGEKESWVPGRRARRGAAERLRGQPRALRFEVPRAGGQGQPPQRQPPAHPD